MSGAAPQPSGPNIAQLSASGALGDNSNPGASQGSPGGAGQGMGETVCSPINVAGIGGASIALGVGDNNEDLAASVFGKEGALNSNPFNDAANGTLLNPGGLRACTDIAGGIQGGMGNIGLQNVGMKEQLNVPAGLPGAGGVQKGR